MFDLERVRASWQRERAAIDAVVSHLDAAQAKEPVRDDGWTTHDIVSHVATAGRAFLRQLQTESVWSSGQAVDVNALNRQSHERNHNRAWPDVLHYWQQTGDDITAFLEAAPATIGEQAAHLPWLPDVRTAGDVLRMLIVHTRSHREELEQR